MQIDHGSSRFLGSVPDQGVRYAEKYSYFHSHWQGHIDASRQLILHGAAQAPGPVVTILGAGDCKEIPLLELLERFDQVNLVDVDERSMARVVNTLSPALKARVGLIVKDLTGGTVLALTEAAIDIIERAAAPRQACRELVNLYKSIEISDPDTEDLRDLQSGYVVSSVVASQLLSFPDRWISQQFEKKFRRKLLDVRRQEYLAAKLELNRRLLQQHAGLLARAAGAGMIYWSCDVRQELVMGRLPPALAQRLGEQMSGYLSSIDWPALNLELKVHPTAGGEFTAYLTSLIGKGQLPPSLELQIIEYMVSAAQTLDPGVTLNLVGGEMSQYFTEALQPVGDKTTWLWHLYPANFYRGGVHKVEAWLLRSLNL